MQQARIPRSLALVAPILFTFSKSRLPSYGSPALPFVALLVAFGTGGGAIGDRGLRLGGTVLALGVAGNAILVPISGDVTFVVKAALAVAALGAIAACLWPRRGAAGPEQGRGAGRPGQEFRRAALCVGCWLLSIGVGIPATPKFLDAERGLWRAVDRLRAPDDDLGVLVKPHDDWGLFPFYAGRDARFFGYESFLAVEPPEKARPENFRPVAAVGEWLRSPGRKWLMVRKEQSREALGAPVVTFVEDEKYAVVTNAPLPAAVSR